MYRKLVFYAILTPFSEVMYQSNRSFNIPHPRAYPGQLTSFPAREGGNLIASLDFMFRVALIPRGAINHGEDKAKDTRFVADWLKSKGLHKLCSVFEGIQEPFILSLACKSVVY